MKICTKCKISKDVKAFHKFRGSKDGLYNWCKVCKKKYDDEYRITEKVQNFYKSEDYIKRKNHYWTDNVQKRLFISSKHSSKNRGLVFEIEEEDIIVPEFCPVLGIRLESERGVGVKKSAPSLDRIDNSKGYTKDNIWVISSLANVMKNNSTRGELLTFCKSMLKFFDNDKTFSINTILECLDGIPKE